MNKRQAKKAEKLKDVVIIYHANCPDGFAAAWAAWKKFGKKASYISAEHQKPIPEGLDGREIYFVDFSYPPEMMVELEGRVKKLVMIDHHLTAMPVIKAIKEVFFDQNHSGAVLAWKYFHPQEKKVPYLLRYIEDRDLWRFKVSGTKEVLSYVDVFEYDFNKWNKLVKDLETSEGRKDYRAKGKIIRQHEESRIKRMVNTLSELVLFEGEEVLSVNTPALISEVGHELVNIRPPFAIVWSERKGIIKVSLRSDGKFDVSKLAQKYGGGGHKAAAGFSFPIGEKFPWKVVDLDVK